MSILIASDIHGSATSMFKFNALVEKIGPDAVIFLGDLLYHGPRNRLPDEYNPAEVAKLLSYIKVPVLAVRGNCDSEVDQMIMPFLPLVDSAWLWLDGQRILALHGQQLEINGGPMKIDDKVIILSGHTHLPMAEKKGLVTYWNPGSLALPKNEWPPSFGLYENGTFKVLSFDEQLLLSNKV